MHTSVRRQHGHACRFLLLKLCLRLCLKLRAPNCEKNAGEQLSGSWTGPKHFWRRFGAFLELFVSLFVTHFVLKFKNFFGEVSFCWGATPCTFLRSAFLCVLSCRNRPILSLCARWGQNRYFGDFYPISGLWAEVRFSPKHAHSARVSPCVCVCVSPMHACWPLYLATLWRWTDGCHHRESAGISPCYPQCVTWMHHCLLGTCTAVLQEGAPGAEVEKFIATFWDLKSSRNLWSKNL